MRRFLKNWLPDHATLQREPSLRWLSDWLGHAHLWHLNRRSVAKGVAIGLFINFLPIPLQMLWAALLAFLCRANLPIAILMTWINNPFTFIPINFLIYQVGAWILGEKNTVSSVPSLPEWHWESIGVFAHEFFTWFSSLGKAYLIGLPIVSISSALLGYFLVQIFWRIVIYRQHRQRTKK